MSNWKTSVSVWKKVKEKVKTACKLKQKVKEKAETAKMKEFRDRLDPAAWKRSGKICTENIGLEQDLQE